MANRFGSRSDRHPRSRPVAGLRGSGTPRPLRPWLGWAAAAAAVLLVAFIAGRAGSDVELASPTPTPTVIGPVAVVFGAALDPDTGEVIQPRTRFAPGDPLAYSASLPAAPGVATMLLEVVRLEAAGEATVQAPTETEIDAASRVIAFSVQAGDLLAIWGAGDYELRMYVGPGTAPDAVGRFTLVAAAEAS
jgi:hypothetical protein